MRKLRFAEIVAWILGLVLLAIWGGYKIHSSLGSRSDLQRFAAAKEESQIGGNTGVALTTAVAMASETEVPAALAVTADVDYSLWAEGRIREYEESLEVDLGVPQAVLRIPKLSLEVAVLEGTGDLVLNRGVGRIEGTAQIGQGGNLGLAGHRDGFFRGLKDMETGDQMLLETLDGNHTYEIDKISIVQPEDVYVLDPTEESRITLVTCYPFYFVGKAPLRYIVHAREVTGGTPEAAINSEATP